MWKQTFVSLHAFDRYSTDRCFLYACYRNPFTVEPRGGGGIGGDRASVHHHAQLLSPGARVYPQPRVPRRAPLPIPGGRWPSSEGDHLGMARVGHRLPSRRSCLADESDAMGGTGMRAPRGPLSDRLPPTFLHGNTRVYPRGSGAEGWPVRPVEPWGAVHNEGLSGYGHTCRVVGPPHRGMGSLHHAWQTYLQP
jgi:hypothetical protein